MSSIYPIRMLNMHLDYLRSAVACEISSSGALSALGETVLDKRKECEELASSCRNDDEQLESIGEDYQLEIEQLMGICFVVCQQMINVIYGRAFRLDSGLGIYNIEDDYKKSRQKNLQLGAHSLSNDISDVEVIDALANLFKHYDEWPVHTHNLNRMSKSERRIVELLKKANVITVVPPDEEDSDEDKKKWTQYAPITKDILLKASEKLGNSEYNETHIFHEIVIKWAEDVLKKYEKLAD